MPFTILGKIATVPIDGIHFALMKADDDHNCLFHAVGYLLERAGLLDDAHTNHVALRAHVVAYVKEHAKQTTPIGYKLRDGLNIANNRRENVDGAQRDAIDQKVGLLEQVNYWGDEACLTAIEHLYDVTVRVYDRWGNAFAVPPPNPVRYYEPWHERETVLRLHLKFEGNAPVHFDAFIPEAQYDPSVDEKDYTVGGSTSPPAALPGSPRAGRRQSGSSTRSRARFGFIGPPTTNWTYHLGPGTHLKLYVPPISHRQFAYVRTVVSDARSIRKKVFSAFGRLTNHVDDPGPAILAVRLRNESEDGRTDYCSASFSIRSQQAELSVAYREHFILPLVRQEGRCIDMPDVRRTTLLIDMDKPLTTARLHGRLFRRAHGKLSAGTRRGGYVADVVIDLPEDPEPVANGFRYIVPGEAVFNVNLAAILAWEDSPYQLVISTNDALAPDDSAWTYFHVPSSWDVNIAETLGQTRVLMLGEDLTPLASVGAKVQGIQNTSLPGDSPTGHEAFDLPASSREGLDRLFRVAGLGNLNKHTSSCFIEHKKESYYALTSWASMISLHLNQEDGCYYARTIYCAGKERHVYRASHAQMSPAFLDGEESKVADIDRHLRAAQSVASALNNYIGTLMHVVGPEKQFEHYLPAEGSTPNDASTRLEAFRQEMEVNDTRCEEACERANAAIKSLSENREFVSFVMTHDIGLDINTKLHYRRFNRAASSTEAQQTRQQVLVLEQALTDLKKAAAPNLLMHPTGVGGGVADFDSGAAPLDHWQRHVLDPPLKMTHAVTAGISSCAGGVTFSDEPVPEHVFLWHLDADLTIPLRQELEALWPGGEDMPPLRSVALITPSPWELNKYRDENLYPAAARDRCRTIFLPRSSHWYGDNAVVAGCDLFGLDLSTPRQLDLVFTYDIDARTEPLFPWREGAAEPEDLPALLIDLHDDLYGTYQFGEREIATSGDLQKYIQTITTQQLAIKRDKRTRANRSCRLPRLGTDVFARLEKAVVPLLTTPCFFANEVGDAEMGRRQTVRWLPGPVGEERTSGSGPEDERELVQANAGSPEVHPPPGDQEGLPPKDKNEF